MNSSTNRIRSHSFGVTFGILLGGYVNCVAQTLPSPAEQNSVVTNAGEELTLEQSMERGQALISTGQLEEALPFLRQAGDAGDLEGLHLCAVVLLKLNNASLFEEARERLQRAAKMGSVGALEELARLAIDGGAGEEPDYLEARELLSKAVAMPGASRSFYLLGRMAAEGLGRERDPATAISYLRRGEAVGSTESLVALADLYLGSGGLVEQDIAQAEGLLLQAFALKSGDAAFRLGMIEERLRGEEPDLEAAYEWFRKASKLGQASAFKKMGDYALAGKKGSEEEAFELYQIAAGLESAEAAYDLARLYQLGRTVPKDLVAAAAWMRIAADRSHLLAQNELGMMLLNGKGVTSNFHESMSYFERAAEGGLPAAQTNLGILLLETSNEEQDRKRAITLFQAAAAKGHLDAAAKLALLYRDGQGVEKDALEAAYWAAKAGADERYKVLSEETTAQLDEGQREKLAHRLKES